MTYGQRGHSEERQTRRRCAQVRNQQKKALLKSALGKGKAGGDNTTSKWSFSLWQKNTTTHNERVLILPETSWTTAASTMFYADIYIYIYTHVYTYMHAYIHTYIQTCIHKYIYIYTYIHTYVYIHVYIYIYTYVYI